MNRRTIQWYAILWIIGLAFLWWPWALINTIADKRPAARRPAALLIVVGCLVASLLIAAVGGADPSRAIAACANLTVWCTLIVVLGRQWTRDDADQVIRGVVDLAAFQGVLVVAARLAYPGLSGTTLPLAHLLPHSLRKEPNVAAFTTIQLTQLDYFGHVVIRTAGIFGNATWAGGFASMTILVVLFAPGSLGRFAHRLPIRVVVLGLAAVTLYWSYSRVDAIALAAGTVVVLAVWMKRFVHPTAWCASTLIVTAILIGALPLVPLHRWFKEANSPRQGSLVTRSEIYSSTFREVMKAPTPLVGAGIKQHAQGLVASQGSHSTYLGLAYRGGILCLLCFVAFLLARGWRGSQENAELAVGLVLFLFLWCFTDDIDAGNLMPLAILIACGLTNTVGNRRPRAPWLGAASNARAEGTRLGSS